MFPKPTMRRYENNSKNSINFDKKIGGGRLRSISVLALGGVLVFGLGYTFGFD